MKSKNNDNKKISKSFPQFLINFKILAIVGSFVFNKVSSYFSPFRIPTHWKIASRSRIWDCNQYRTSI